MNISLSKILENPFLVIDCLFDQEFYNELIKDEKSVREFTKYFKQEENTKKLQGLIKNGDYRQYKDKGTKKLRKEITSGTISDFFSVATGIPISAFSPIVKKLLENVNSRNVEETNLLENLIEELNYKNVENNLMGHINAMESNKKDATLSKD